MKPKNPFILNKSTEEYFQLIAFAQSRCHRTLYLKKEAKNLLGYVEDHHIIPRSLGGNNLTSNKVWLTAKEHLTCHILLTQMTTGIDCSKMWNSLWRMLNKQNTNQEREYNIPAELYEIARLKHAENQSLLMSGENNPFYGKKHSAKTKEKMSVAKSGKTYEEIYGEDAAIILKEKRRVSSTGLKRSTETREKIRQTKIGKARPASVGIAVSKKLSGKKRSESTIIKMKLAREKNKKLCEWCGKETSLTNYRRWHGGNCKHSQLPLRGNAQ